MTATMAPPEGLAGLLAARGDPMAACRESPWLQEFLRVPQDASVPLAMSGRHPRAAGSYGAECLKWAKAELGLTPRWWQALAITRQLEHDADGVLVYREVNESGPRRIGKSVRLRATALWRIAHADLIGEPQLAMLVSKDLAVGKEIHRGAWRWAEAHDPKWKVTRLNGGQEVESPAGDRWLLRAMDAVYGYDVGYGQVDESWSVDPVAITDGLEPALLERLWAQLHLTTTAHVKATSLMRRRLVAALRAADPDVLLLLWGAHPDADFADRRTWKAASPHWSVDREALMARKLAAALAGQDEPEFDDPDPVRGWAAQYLNVWPLLLVAGSSALVMPAWPLCATAPAPVNPAALGVAMDVERVWLSCGVASAGDLPHVGPVTSGRTGRTLRVRAADPEFGRAQFVEEVAAISKRLRLPVGLDRKGPGADLEIDLRNAGARVIPGNLDDWAEACANLYDAVETKDVSHAEYLELDQAVAGAGWRKVGDRRVWARQGGDISMLEAVTWALWASTHKPARRAAGF